MSEFTNWTVFGTHVPADKNHDGLSQAQFYQFPNGWQAIVGEVTQELIDAKPEAFAGSVPNTFDLVIMAGGLGMAVLGMLGYSNPLPGADEYGMVSGNSVDEITALLDQLAVADGPVVGASEVA